jgi:hypothetical protein
MILSNSKETLQAHGFSVGSDIYMKFYFPVLINSKSTAVLNIIFLLFNYKSPHCSGPRCIKSPFL